MEIIEIGRHSFCAKIDIRNAPGSCDELHSLAKDVFSGKGVSLPKDAEITAYSNGMSLLLFVSEKTPRVQTRHFCSLKS